VKKKKAADNPAPVPDSIRRLLAESEAVDHEALTAKAPPRPSLGDILADPAHHAGLRKRDLDMFEQAAFIKRFGATGYVALPD
jgi:hypothetical protein